MNEEIGLLKNFRRRFIAIMLLLVGTVALVAFIAIGMSSYQTIRADISTTLSRAARPLDGVPHGGSALQDKGDDDDDDADDSERLATHAIPVCVVLVSYSDLSTCAARYDSIGLDDATVEGAVSEALSRTVAPGEGAIELSDYGLYCKVTQGATGFRIAFVPESFMWGALGKQVLTLVAIWVVLMLAVLLITIFLSRYVTRPVARAWSDQQRFIADASHELKTPLTVIMADVSILQDNEDKTVREQSTWVEGISNEAVRMKQLTEDLLTLAQADAGMDLKQVMGDVDLSSVVEGQVLQFDAVAFERGLSIEDEVDESIHVTGDQIRLENMVKTLLENACKYSERGGAIEVRLRAERGQAVLSVHNGGDPIPAEDLPHLFDRFYRSDKARTQADEAASFGLGLSIAKSTAEMHGGKIGVTSDKGGTTFTVKIPLLKARG